MSLGIYFGTTQMVVITTLPSQPYPPVNFQTSSGEWLPNYPICIAAQGNKRRYGLDALAKQHKPGWSVLRAWQYPADSTETEWNVSLGKRSVPALELLTAYLTQLRMDLSTRSSLQDTPPDEPLTIRLAVAAEASDGQRRLVQDAFEHAGFVVQSVIQETIDPNQAATALNLALAGSTHLAKPVNTGQERLTHTFGVWREAEDGKMSAFDPLFYQGSPLPEPEAGPWIVQRFYHPAHNIGHFRYLECSHLTTTGEPTGDIIEWSTLVFAFDGRLSGMPALETRVVERAPQLRDDWIEERYECSADGTLTVTFYNHTTGYNQRYMLTPI